MLFAADILFGRGGLSRKNNLRELVSELDPPHRAVLVRKLLLCSAAPPLSRAGACSSHALTKFLSVYLCFSACSVRSA